MPSSPISTSSNDAYKTVIDAINLSAIAINADGSISYSNDHFDKMLNRPLNEIIGSSIFTYLPKEQHYLFRALLKGIKSFANQQFTLLTSDGKNDIVYFSELSLDSEKKMLCFTILTVDQFKNIRENFNKEEVFSKIRENITDTLADPLQSKYLIPKALEIICTSLDWNAGEIWILNEPKKVLYCIGLWHDEEDIKFMAFKKVTHELLLNATQTFAEKVMLSREPIWFDNFPEQFPAEIATIENEIKVALGFPIFHQEKTIGIAIFFSRKLQKPDKDILTIFKKSIAQVACIIMQESIFKDFEYINQHDSVTGVLNRPAFENMLHRTIRDTKNKKVAVIKLSLNPFDVINDVMGHNAGNILLRITADKLKELLPNEQDILARIDTNKFGILLQDVNEIQPIINFANKLLTIVKQPVFINKQEIFITANLAISIYPKDGNNAETLLMNTAAALLHAEHEGRDSFQFSSPDISNILAEKLRITSLLKVALDENQFQLFYQPKVELKTGTIVGLEALLRWQDPEKGCILPESFLPVAEETDLIIPIGEWVLREVFKHLHNKEFDIPIAINISLRQLKKQYELANCILQLITEYKINPQNIELEMTESVLMSDVARILEVLAPLKKVGIKFAIDDFGTGYSSFSYLQNFFPDRIKLDKSFIERIPGDINSTKIVKTMLILGKTLGIKTTAEGVEKADQLKYLINQGCDEMQGYYFAKPLPLDKVKLLLKNNVILNFPK